jgi:hypothetical protein
MSSTPTHCTQCGEPLGQGYRFCLKCGAPASMSPVEREAQDFAPPPAPKKGVPAWVIVLSIGCLLLLLAMLAGGGWFLYKKLKSGMSLQSAPVEASQPVSTEAQPVQEQAAPSEEQPAPEPQAQEPAPAMEQAAPETAPDQAQNYSQSERPKPSPPPLPISGTFHCRKGVEFDVDPEDALVAVDGTTIGIADDWDGKRGGRQYIFKEPGEHIARFSLKGYKTAWVKIIVGPDASNSIVSVDTKLKQARRY